MARSELAERFHSLFHFLPEIDLSFLERELVPRLALGDPVLVVEWSDAGLQAACARETAPDNPANCKDTLIQIMTSHQSSGIDPTGNGNIFTFSSDPQFAACRENLPQWSLSLGARAAAVANMGPPIPAIGKAHVIRATSRIDPDIILESFFEIR